MQEINENSKESDLLIKYKIVQSSKLHWMENILCIIYAFYQHVKCKMSFSVIKSVGKYFSLKNIHVYKCILYGLKNMMIMIFDSY